MVGGIFKLNINIRKLDQFINLLNEIIECVEIESTKINSGQPSRWESNQLDGVVRPEISELLSFALNGKIFFKHGKRQRVLESTYLITDSFSELDKTPLGRKVLELQKFYNSL